MRDDNMRRALGRLEHAAPDASARDRARNMMLAAFDNEDVGDDLDEAELPNRGPAVERGRAEVVSLVTADRRADATEVEPTRSPSRVFAAAAAVVLVMLLGGALAVGLADQSNAPEIVDSNDVVAEGNDSIAADRPYVDDDLPRQIEGRFTTGVLGGTTAFVVRDSLWLVRHEDDLVRLVVDPDDPASASLVIARPGVPTPVLGDQPVVDFLRSGSSIVDFQLQPLQVGGVSATYGRGQYSGPDCGVGEPCLVLYESPMRLGLQTGVINDFVERPMSDGGTVTLIASIPFADYGITPFAEPFESIITTISFTDTDPNGRSG